MSRKEIVRKDGTVFAFGFDAPTGGYFWQLIKDDEEINSASGILLSELVDSFPEVSTAISDLVKDVAFSPKPTPLQINIGKMFGKDIIESLNNVSIDLFANFKDFVFGNDLEISA